MTNYNLRWVMPLFIIIAGVFTACNSPKDISNLDESFANVPSLNLIEGADHMVTTINKDRNKSNYTITMDGLMKKTGIAAGQYQAFCALWDVPIKSDNHTYGDVQLHSIEGEDYWKAINYMVHNLDRYYKEKEDLTWIEIQIALWSLMDHKTFDLNIIPEDNLPPYVRDGSFSRKLITEILRDVEENKHTYTAGSPGNRAVYAQIPDAQDQIVILPGGEIEEAFEVTFQNFANDAGSGIIQRVGGNTAGTSVRWNESGASPIKLTIKEGPSEGSVLLKTKINTDNSNINTTSGTGMPAGCSFEDMDRLRIQVAAGDPGIKIILNWEFIDINGHVTVENGVTPGNKADFVIPNLDFSQEETIHLILEFEGNTLSDNDTSKVQIQFGCPA